MSASAPRHGGQLAAIGQRFGVDVSRLIDFSASINPDGPSPAVIAALRAALDRPETLTLYPDLGEAELKNAVAAYAQVEREQLLVANGFVPLLDATLRALRIETCLVPTPCFVEYRTTLERNRVLVLKMPLNAACSFAYDVEELLATPADAILLANPQNPTGALLDRRAMTRLIAEAGQRGTCVLLDEAFIDYIPEDSMAPFVGAHPRLIVFRSVTKCFGIPGLRAAYAAANRSLCRQIEIHLPPWSITTLASIGVIAALNDPAYAGSFRAVNQVRKDQLQQGLLQAGLTVHPGAANSLLVRVPGTCDAEELWQKLIVEQSILVRNCANFEGLAPGYLRVAVRTQEENARLIQAMASRLS